MTLIYVSEEFAGYLGHAQAPQFYAEYTHELRDIVHK